MKDERSAIARRHLFYTGYASKSMIWYFCDILLIYYLHARIGMSGDALVLVTVPALLFSGLLDVALGYLLCRAAPRRILTIQAVGAVATGVAVVALFAIGSGNAVAMLSIMASFRIAYSLYDVTHNALTSLLPADEVDAHRYVVRRSMLSSAARLAVAGAAMLLVGESAPLAGWEAVAMLPAAVLVMASGLAIARVPLPPAATGSVPLPTPRWVLSGNVPLIVAAFFHAAALSTPARFVPFMPDGRIFLFVFIAGTLAGPVAADLLTGRLGRTGGVIALTGLTVVGLAGFAMPAWPLAGAVGIALHGIGVGGTGMLLWRDMSRIVRDHARRTGERADLPGFALLTGAIKAGIAVSGVLIALLIDGAASHPMATIAGIASIGGMAYVAAMRSKVSRAYPAHRTAPA